MLPTTWSGRGLLESGALTRIPSHGIGRSMKAGKEEIVGLLVALNDTSNVTRRRRSPAGSSAIRGVYRRPGRGPRSGDVDRAVSPPSDRPVARTAIRIEPAAYGRSATEIVQAFEARDR